MRSSRLLPLVATLALAVVLEAPATAQTLPSIDVRTWRPSTDPGASLVLEPMTVPALGQWNAAAWLNYTDHPVTLRENGTSNVALRPVANLFGGDLTGAIGIGLRMSVGLDLPLFLYQNGTSPLPSTVTTTSSVPTTGLGDLGINVKGSLVPNEEGGFGLAAQGIVTLPTGDRTSFMGDGSVTAAARVLADYSLVFADLQASLGYTLHTDHHVWPDPSVGGITFGDQIPWSIGIRINPTLFGIDRSNRETWEVAGHGSLPAGPVGPFGSGNPGSASLSPVLLAVSDRVALGHYRDTFVLAGIDIGLNTAVGVPAVRFIAGVGWAPRAHDMDKDGIPDDVDQCAEIAEDRDGYEDADGCPEVDDDNDGIVDREDACPRVAGFPSADPKKNGCPGADTDGDGIPDASDACPRERGLANDDPKKNGCPTGDRDGDGVPDYLDKCPDQPEDLDGFEDGDGCPDPDNDGDGIPDAADACPNVPGEPSSDPRRKGCPNADRDGDTYDNDVDQCPDAAEVFNGVKDDDGCPDEGGHPLLTIDVRDTHLPVRLASPIRFSGSSDAPEVDKASLMTLRALALELNRHSDWTLAIGARPGAGGEKASVARAYAVAHVLVGLTHREGAAEAVGWDAVKRQAGGDGSLGLLILAGPAPSVKAPPQAPLPPSAPKP